MLIHNIIGAVCRKLRALRSARLVVSVEVIMAGGLRLRSSITAMSWATTDVVELDAGVVSVAVTGVLVAGDQFLRE